MAGLAESQLNRLAEMNTSESPAHVVSLKAWLIFIFLSFIWGGSFILIKKGLIAFSPVEVGAMRIAVSALAFLPIFFIARVKFPKGKIKYAAAIALTGNGIPAFLYAIAETRLGSAVTGVLNSLTPIFALIIGVLLFGSKLHRYQILGVMLGAIGLVILVMGEKDWTVSGHAGLVVVATACYGLSANLVKKYGQDIHPIALTSMGFFSLAGPVLLILLGAGTHEKIVDPAVWEISMPALLLLALVCTVMANVLFYWLLQETNVVFGSAIAYAIPCMALVWGSLDGEILTWLHFLGFLIIITAIYTLRRN